MPIEVDADIQVFSEDDFHALAYRVMGVIFETHNEFGRLMDEEVYQHAIHKRCEAVGVVPARREVEIKVSYQDFQKSYFMDLLFAAGLMVELKTVETINDAHHAQALHYLLLTGMKHGLVVNLRQEQINRRYVSTTLDLAERRRFILHDSDWQSFSEPSDRLRQILLQLFADWGGFLQTSLYREAIVHFFGGPSRALQRIPIYDGKTAVGSHEVCLITEDTAFALTTLKDGKPRMDVHLRRFLSHTRLACMQWVNMDNHNIEFRTLINPTAV